MLSEFRTLLKILLCPMLIDIMYLLTLLGLTSYFYTKAWGGDENSPPLKIDIFLKKNMLYQHEVNFCINSVLFWCIALVFSPILAYFSNFIEKSAKFGCFQKIGSYSCYIHQKKAKMIQKLIQRQIDMIYPKK